VAKKGTEERIQEKYLEALKLIAPGTSLREGISYILQSGSGGLIVLGDSKKVRGLCEGGFEVDRPYAPTYLYELSKMDGAIVLSSEAKHIIAANVFLVPSRTIPSVETGTRHRAAERMSKQTGAVVLAISERRASMTLYVGPMKHVMDNIPTLANKAAQALQTLEKYTSILHNAMRDLGVREFQDMVTVFDVCGTIQRAEMVRRIGEEIGPQIIELGSEGRLIELQLREHIADLDEGMLMIDDYYKSRSGFDADDARKQIAELTGKELLNLNNISNALGYGLNMRSVDTYLTPRGYRVLYATQRIPRNVIDRLVATFGNLQAVLRAPREQLVAVDGVGEVMAERIRVGLDLLRNQLSLELR